MGSGRDKKKKAKERKGGPSAGRGAEKTERKTRHNDEKKERRTDKRLAGDEDDLDALLAKMAMEDKARTAVEVLTDVPPPSARVNASFVPYVTPRGTELLLFGGEYSDHSTGKVYVYKDLYRFNPERQRWSKVVGKGPGPRCAHQAFVHRTFMYVWGGEFSSPNQERFMHFRDLWRLDLTSNEWDQLPLKGGPSARSGHRMVLHKGRALLFGGFFDTGKEVRYYNDLWALDLSELCWTSLGNPSAGPWPAPRSGCQLTMAGDTLYLYGGYVKAKDEDDPELEHGKAHDDMWTLDLNTLKWERVKKAGMAPRPRCSFALAPHKNRAFLFGGVSDNETKRGEDLSSEFHNDLYVFNFLTRRWYVAALRPPKDYEGAAAAGEPDQQQQQQQKQLPAAAAAGGQRRPPQPAGTAGGRDAAVHAAATAIQACFRGYLVRKAYKAYQLGGVVSELLYSPAAYGLDLSARNMPKPRARISAQVAVLGNTMWLLGGVVEVGETEITLDDMWKLDLAKLDGWALVKENSVGEDVFRAAAAAAAGGGDDSEWEEASDDGEGDD